MSPTTAPIAPVRREADATRPAALVWIDAREAIIVAWADGQARVVRVESAVPAHHRSTGHVRHDPSIRHGGGGPQRADEPHRHEHLAQFMREVEAGLPAGNDLYLIGPGAVHERLADRVREHDRRSGCARTVRCETSARHTDRQLVALLRRRAGSPARRRTVGPESPRQRATRQAGPGHAAEGTEG